MSRRPGERRLGSTDPQERPQKPLPWWLAASAAGFSRRGRGRQRERAGRLTSGRHPTRVSAVKPAFASSYPGEPFRAAYRWAAGMQGQERQRIAEAELVHLLGRRNRYERRRIETCPADARPSASTENAGPAPLPLRSRHLPRIASVAGLARRLVCAAGGGRFVGLQRHLSAAKSRRQEAFSAS